MPTLPLATSDKEKAPLLELRARLRSYVMPSGPQAAKKKRGTITVRPARSEAHTSVPGITVDGHSASASSVE